MNLDSFVAACQCVQGYQVLVIKSNKSFTVHAVKSQMDTPIIHSAHRYSSDSFLHTVHLCKVMLCLKHVFVFCFVFPLGGNAELMSLASFGLNYVFWCTAVCNSPSIRTYIVADIMCICISIMENI